MTNGLKIRICVEYEDFLQELCEKYDLSRSAITDVIKEYERLKKIYRDPVGNLVRGG